MRPINIPSFGIAAGEYQKAADICGGLPHVLHRMLIDSRPGHLELLPALPTDWHEGRIEGIRARGNIEIQSLEWTRARVKAVIVSPKSQTIEVNVPGEESPRRVQLEGCTSMLIDAKRHR